MLHEIWVKDLHIGLKWTGLKNVTIKMSNEGKIYFPGIKIRKKKTTYCFEKKIPFNYKYHQV